jgi:TRAP-type C4-dicarboxylate transport system permease small subunit
VQALLLIGCYLPMALIPALLPFRILQPFKPIYRWISPIPIASALAVVLLLDPLTRSLSYAVALLPVLISVFSLTTGVIGYRLVRQAEREGASTGELTVETVLAALPFLISILVLGYAIVSAWLI